MNEKMILELYKNAVNGYKCAVNEDEKFKEMHNMAELERTSIELYGEKLLEEIEEMKQEIER